VILYIFVTLFRGHLDCTVRIVLSGKLVNSFCWTNAMLNNETGLDHRLLAPVVQQWLKIFVLVWRDRGAL